MDPWLGSAAFIQTFAEYWEDTGPDGLVLGDNGYTEADEGEGNGRWDKGESFTDANNNGNWEILGSSVEGEALGDIFGSSVGISLTDEEKLVLAVGAPLNDGEGSNSGHVRVFKFDEFDQDEDAKLNFDKGVQVVLDHMSYPYILGSKIDYVENLMGSKFTVENPNASSTCGCGASFSI